MTRYPLVIGVVLLSLLAVACRGEEKTPGPAETGTPEGGFFGLPTPAGTPIISDSQFEFPARGYSVSIPAGWSAQASYVLRPDEAIDAFFSPTPDEGVQPSITLSCETVEAGTPLEAYAEEKVASAAETAGQEPQVSEGQVAGLDAQVVDYSLNGAAPTLDRTDIG